MDDGYDAVWVSNVGEDLIPRKLWEHDGVKRLIVEYEGFPVDDGLIQKQRNVRHVEARADYRLITSSTSLSYLNLK